jgi:hypothetical protein
MEYDNKSFRYQKELTTACVGSENLTAVVMKGSIFWDITPCSLLRVGRNMENGGDKFLRNIGG